jgi:hypothetical protein
VKPSEGRDSMRAAPRWPAEPVTRTSYEAIDLVICRAGVRIYNCFSN